MEGMEREGTKGIGGWIMRRGNVGQKDGMF